MNLSITQGAAAAVTSVAIITRIFFGLIIDSSDLYNAAWLCVPLGGFFAFPLIYVLHHCGISLHQEWTTTCSCGALLKKASAVIFLFFASFNGAIALSGISSSASYIGFETTAPIYLMLPVIAIGIWCAFSNGNAIGFSARIWCKSIPLLLLITIIIQLPDYRPSWLSPILGYGWKGLLEGSIKTAGWISSMTGACIIAERNASINKEHFKPLKLLAIITAVATILIATQLMMSPSLIYSPGRSRLYQLDTLLTNGRSALSLQFPMIVIWFTSLLFLWAYNCYIASAMLQYIFGKLDGRLCGVISVICSLLTLSCTPRSTESIISNWQYIANFLGVALIIVSQLRRKHLCKN